MDPAMEVELEKSSYYPYEMAGLIIRNVSGDLNSAQLMIDQSNPVDFFVSDSVLVFIMPSLQTGAHLLELVIGESTYPVNFTLNASPTENNPDQYMAGVIQGYQETISYLDTNKHNLDPQRKTLLENDLETINGWMTNLTAQYDALSDEEKKEAVMIMKANEWWIQELHESVLKLNQFDNTGTRGWVEDWDKEVEKKMGDFVAAKITVIKHIPKIVAWITLGALTGSIIPGFGTAGLAPLLEPELRWET
jgi:hypothetical protein